MKARAGFWGDLAIAVSTAAFVAFVVPLQSYLGNQNLFAFTTGRLLLELTAGFVAGAALFFLLLRLLGKPLRGFLQAALVALLVCAYLETGFLSARLPEIDGGYMPALAETGRGLLDAAVWGVVFLVFVGGIRRTRAWLSPCAVVALAMGLASLFDVRRPVAAPDAAPGAPGFAAQRDVVASVRFSPTRNVLVFILDSMPGSLARKAVCAEPEIAAKFDGFRAYADNVSMHDCTKYGVPALMTGRHFDPATDDVNRYAMTMFGPDSFLSPYFEAGAAVAFSPDLLPYGRTNLPLAREVPTVAPAHEGLALASRSREVPYLSLLQLSLFRLMPYFAKAPFLYGRIRHAALKGSARDDFWHEPAMYGMLASAPVADDARTFLGVFHSRGAHPPLVFDRTGRRVARHETGVAEYRELVAAPLVLLGRLLDVLRAKGLYDSALIVVTADHGLLSRTGPAGRNPRDDSILWVKAEGAKGPLAWRDAKTSTAKVAPLLKAACAKSPSADEIEATLATPRRFFRAETSDGSGFEEYEVE